MRNIEKALLSVVTCAAVCMPANAEMSPKDIVLDTKSKQPLPYVIDQRGVVARSGTYGRPGHDTLCWRTGYWSVDLAAKTPVVESRLPAGCYCEPDLMPKGTCEPVAVASAAEAPKAAPLPVPVAKPTAEKITLAADALFDFNKSLVRTEGKAKLDEVAAKAGALKIETIIVVGHTDRFSSTDYNQKLSEHRAVAVKEYLVSKGIAADRIFTEGKGKTQPVTKRGECKGPKSKKVVACLQPDRRVTIEIVGTK